MCFFFLVGKRNIKIIKRNLDILLLAADCAVYAATNVLSIGSTIFISDTNNWVSLLVNKQKSTSLAKLLYVAMLIKSFLPLKKCLLWLFDEAV